MPDKTNCHWTSQLDIKRLLLIVYIFSLHLSLIAQATSVRFAVSGSNVDRPVSVKIDNPALTESKEELGLFRVQGDREINVAIQFEQNKDQVFWFIADQNVNTKYVLRKKKSSPVSPSIRIIESAGDLKFESDGKSILNYRFGMTDPPEGVDSLYQKSGYIHPLWSPSGEVLSRIQPPDHYHHYGIWGPWTRTVINDRNVDFWNLYEGQGTVLFDSFTHQEQGPVFSEVKAKQLHLDFKAPDHERISIEESLHLRVWNLETGKDRFMIDYTSDFVTPIESGLKLIKYRYGGGIGFRATELWHRDNTKVLTSEGKDRSNADGSNARWCIISGQSSESVPNSGILFLSHPSNRSHPEPMRVWPEDANEGRGDMFFEFSPIRHKSWNIEHQKEYSLIYRMVIFEGEMTEAEAEQHWNAFANNSEIKI